MVSLMVFSHDGLRDSLTHLAAPPYFYESLRRELISAQRDRRKFSLLRLQLLPKNNPDLPSQLYSDSLPSDSLPNVSLPSDSLYESAIIDFAELIKISVRGEDICARLGRFEFTLIVRAQLDIARSIAQRIQASWRSDYLECLSATLSVNNQESTLELLNRLDNQELLDRTQSLAN
jgi:GGDEF domain-containing protein